MGKVQKKTGKGRLDKYYKLAKYVLFLLPVKFVDEFCSLSESKGIEHVRLSSSFNSTKSTRFWSLRDAV